MSVTIHSTSLGSQTSRHAGRRQHNTRGRRRQKTRTYITLYVAKYAFVREMLPSVELLGQVHKTFGVIDLYKITHAGYAGLITRVDSDTRKAEFKIRNSKVSVQPSVIARAAFARSNPQTAIRRLLRTNRSQ